MKISKRTQSKFAEFASECGTLREITEAFENEGFTPDPTFQPSVFGERRALVGKYHAGIDLSDPEQQKRLLDTYVETIDSWCTRDSHGRLPLGPRALVASLRRDEAPIDEQGNLISAPSLSLDLAPFSTLTNTAVLEEHLGRMAAGIKEDPAAAIGSAKELAESVCKLVLDDYGLPSAKAAKLLELYKTAANALAISRTSVPNSARGSQASQKVLQNLATMVQSLAELRDELGLGHGRSKTSPALERHARLACNASPTLTEFVLETWQTRKVQVP
jgi:hypothetical protein